MQKVLIAHKSEVFARALAKRLQLQYEVHICKTGTDALSLIDRLKPDILFIYLPLLYTHGIKALKETAFHPPVILALTNIVTDAIYQDAEAVGIRELITIPCRIDHTVSRLENILLNEKTPSPEI